MVAEKPWKYWANYSGKNKPRIFNLHTSVAKLHMKESESVTD